MVKQKVSLQWDIAVPIFPAPCMVVHQYIGPPAPGPPFALHTEIPTMIAWPPGGLLGQHVLTSSVNHTSQSIALEGHDCGVMIIHVNIGPPAPVNVLLALHIPFSKRKVMFSASTVKMNGTSTGLSDLLSVPTPMLVCENPVSCPVGFPLTNAMNTVNVGMTAGDFFAGLAAIVVSMAVDFILSGMPSNPADDAIEAAFKAAVGGDAIAWALGVEASIVTGVIQIATTGQGTISVSVGSPWGNITLSVAVGNDGSVSVSGSLRLGVTEGSITAKRSQGTTTVTGKTTFLGKQNGAVTPILAPKAGSSALIGGEPPL